MRRPIKFAMSSAEFIPLNCLAALRFAGADVASFLQGQLSADMENMPQDEWRRAAYCTPQGRIVATMSLARLDDGVVAFLPASAADAVATRLSRFVLRAKVVISRISSPVCVAGAEEADEKFNDATSDRKARREGDFLFLDEGGSCSLRVDLSSKEAGESDLGNVSDKASAAWRRLQILRGVPWIGGETAEKFIPQHVNWDLLGGVDFKKGCYVGQEIIARLYYLGNVKRRGWIMSGEGAPPAPGSKIEEADVVDAVPNGGRFSAFVSAPRGVADLMPPPYPLPSAEEDKKSRPKL